MAQAEALVITTGDHTEISATLYTGEKKSNHLIIVGPATGAPQAYYRRFAEYAADYPDFDAITFDYRGIGQSLDGSVIDSKATMSEWGKYDTEAVIEWADKRYDKVFLIGHSVAGQIFPKAASKNRITAAYLVGSQSAYFGCWRGLWLLYVLFFWFILIPVTTFIYDYLPGWAMGGNIPIPKKVALEWRKWGIHREGVILGNSEARHQFETVKIPIHFVNIEDDKLLGPSRATQQLMHQYKNAVTTFQFISPKNLKLKRIGHFGFFKKKFQKQLWPMPMFFFTQFVRKLDERK
ncbi:hypothetical protein [Marinoscillum sp.]|uniref:alpha/beta hydrolase family protein n=1 Tax=Marinoscillum sp. TaxID=2024838 RepID=UPI003BA940C2